MAMKSADALQDYGIEQEQSDLRIHVCPKVRRVYVFRTAVARRLIEAGRYPVKKPTQNGVVTAEGYAIPVQDIRGCGEYEVPSEVWEDAAFRKDMTTSEKGAAAVIVAKTLLKSGYVRFTPEVTEENALADQYAGIDLRVSVVRSVQVKCDYDGGNRERGGTGNLFIQTAEINPHKLY